MRIRLTLQFLYAVFHFLPRFEGYSVLLRHKDVFVGSWIAGYANRPVDYVSFWDAARFTNWLHNGQGLGGDTENGAYTLGGYTLYGGVLSDRPKDFINIGLANRISTTSNRCPDEVGTLNDSQLNKFISIGLLTESQVNFKSQ